MNKKIAFVLPTTLGNSGGIKIIFEYAEQINKLGYKCDVIYPLIPSNYKYYKFKSVKKTIKYLFTFCLNMLNYNYNKFKNNYKSVNIIKILSLNLLWKKNFDYNIYVATAWDTYYYIKDLNAKKKYLVQSYETWSGPTNFVEETYKNAEFEYYTISKFLQKELYQKFNTKSTIIYNPIETNIKNSLTKNYENNRYGIIYRHEKNKNFNLIKKFLEENKEYQKKFYCLGRNIPIKYKKLFKKCYDGNNQYEVRQFYLDINTFIMPSNHEGFSLPIMEAISFNNIIISNTTGILLDFCEEIDYISINNNECVKYQDIIKAIYYAEQNSIEKKENSIIKNRLFYEKYIEHTNWINNSKKILHGEDLRR